MWIIKNYSRNRWTCLGLPLSEKRCWRSLCCDVLHRRRSLGGKLSAEPCPNKAKQMYTSKCSHVSLKSLSLSLSFFFFLSLRLPINHTIQVPLPITFDKLPPVMHRSRRPAVLQLCRSSLPSCPSKAVDEGSEFYAVRQGTGGLNMLRTSSCPCFYGCRI